MTKAKSKYQQRRERRGRLHQFVAEVVTAKADGTETINVTTEFAGEAAEFVAEILLARAKGGMASRGRRRLRSDPQSVRWREAKRRYRAKNDSLTT